MSVRRRTSNFLIASNGLWSCDMIAALNWIVPTWFALWKKSAWGWFEFQRNHHLEDMARGRSSEGRNLTKAFGETSEAVLMSNLHLAYDLGIVSDAGIETTASALMGFLLATAAHPDETKAVQCEIDQVVGRGRLPALEHQAALPLVGAYINEVMRWRPVTHGGLPHSNLEDELYNGYIIPKGSVILADTMYEDTPILVASLPRYRQNFCLPLSLAMKTL
ncbi:cytochrome P450 [Xylariomycetidae sp. FL2044]|nr:cytochrome P450 [Xylariomycetidae sp. FL2044]